MKPLVLDHLKHLVAFDTQNPPREIAAEHPVFDYLRTALGTGFAFELTDYGKGRVSLLAKRGQSPVLFNVHLDTVPFGNGWKRLPNRLTVEGNKAFGRGVCDIKSGAASLIAAATSSEADVVLLFTTDEEGIDNCCVREFCKAHADQFALAVVAEPTECRAVTGHRGYLSAAGKVAGVAGHSSQQNAVNESANHRAVRWSARALESVGEIQTEMNDASCFNIGQLAGGKTNNVVADSTTIGWSARLPPGFSNEEYYQRLTSGKLSEHIQWRQTLSEPPLPSDLDQLKTVEKVINNFRLESGGSVDFWTEAALFSQAGIPAIVLGPGNIEQAHTADEWVEIDQLIAAAEIYRKILVSVSPWFWG